MSENIFITEFIFMFLTWVSWLCVSVWRCSQGERHRATGRLGETQTGPERERAERRGQRREVLVADRKRGQSQHTGNNFHIHIWTTPGDHFGHEETEAWTETIDGDYSRFTFWRCKNQAETEWESSCEHPRLIGSSNGWTHCNLISRHCAHRTNDDPSSRQPDLSHRPYHPSSCLSAQCSGLLSNCLLPLYPGLEMIHLMMLLIRVIAWGWWYVIQDCDQCIAESVRQHPKLSFSCL